MSEQARKLPTLYRGQVTRKSGDKTIRVEMAYQARHPKYGKILKRRTIALAHDPNNAARVGDQVEICKCRPLSKMKSWRLVRVVQPVVTSQNAEQE